MIVISLIGDCCGIGVGYANRLYAKLLELKQEVGMGGYAYDESNTFVMKYKIKKEQVPMIVLDEFNLVFEANKVDDPKYFDELIKKLVK